MDSQNTPLYTDDTYAPETSIGRLLADANGLMQRTLERRTRREFGITAPQWVVLMRIGSGYAATASDLSRALGSDSGSMTRMLDRLETQGLIRRERSDDDRRVARLSLTESGRELFPRLRPVGIDALNHAFHGFSAAEVEHLSSYLRRIVANVDGE